MTKKFKHSFYWSRLFWLRDRNITEFKRKRKCVDSQVKLPALKDQFWGSGLSAFIFHFSLALLVSAETMATDSSWITPSQLHLTSKKDRFWVQAPCNLTYRLCQPWSIMQNFRGAKSSILSKNFFCTPYSHKGGFTKLVTLKVLVIEKVLTLKVRWSRVIRQQWLLDKDVLWSFLFLADVTSLPPLTHEPQPVG